MEALDGSESESAAEGGPDRWSTRPLLTLATTASARQALGYRAVGLLAAMLLLASAALGASAGSLVRPGVRVESKAGFLQEVLARPGASSSCSRIGQNCMRTNCCLDASLKCYLKDSGWAECRSWCTPGVNPTEPVERQTPWACTDLQQQSAATSCSPVGQNCTHTKCCLDAGFKCYYKDPGWAECKTWCQPGVHLSEPVDRQTPWACWVAGQGHDPTWPSSTTKIEEASALNLTTQPPTTVAPTTSQPAIKASTGVVSTQTSTIVEPTTFQTATSTQPSTSVALATSRPATEAIVGPHPTILCIALMLSYGGEVALIRSQLAGAIGIFGCNGWDVYSNTSLELSPGPPKRLVAKVLPGSLQCNFSHQYAIPNALNSEIFYRLWQRVFKDGHYLQFDWTVKIDPDTVVLPERLRNHFGNMNPEDPVYLNNCDIGLHGPVEALSKGGMTRFLKGLEDCHDFLSHEWMTYGEDVWLQNCLKHLGVPSRDDFGLLYERACRPYQWPLPCTTGAATFHPLKTPEEYVRCQQNAER